MPVIEIILFGAGITIGGQRAWQRLKEDLGYSKKEDETAPGTQQPPPLSARSYSTERRGIQDLFDDIEYLVSPRTLFKDKEPPPFPIPDEGAACIPSSPRLVKTLPVTARTSEASPRGNQSFQAQDDVDPAKDEAGVGGMWIASAINRLTSRLSPRGGSPGGSPGVAPPEPKDKVVKAVRALAGENRRYVHRADDPKRSSSSGGDWSPALTPRQSALKSDASPSTTPRGQRGRIKWDEEVKVRRFIETAEELQSRQEHWARILRNAEREAYHAYVASAASRRAEREQTQRQQHSQRAADAADAAGGRHRRPASAEGEGSPRRRDDSQSPRAGETTPRTTGTPPTPPPRDPSASLRPPSPTTAQPPSPRGSSDERPHGGSSAAAPALRGASLAPPGPGRPPSVPKLNFAALPAAPATEARAGPAARRC